MIIPVNKPKGWTSFSVVKEVRAITGEKKVGHAGTLDPFAEGVLIIGVGRSSTRRLGYFTACEKEYIAELLLGVGTETLDLEGKIVEQREIPAFSDREILKVFEKFIGKIEQTPPMYSAKRVNGTRLYDLAREGVEVERKPVIVEIKKLELLSYSDNVIRFSVVCGRGTYVRQLASDIARQLGTVGHLISLKRTRIGDYQLNECVTVRELRERWLSIVK